MDIYARELQHALHAKGIDADLYVPKHALERWRNSKLVMRYLRYWAYRKLIKGQGGAAQVHHVADHGYAHLHTNLSRGISAVTVHDLIPYLTWVKQIPSEGKIRKPRLNIYSLKYIQRFDRVITVSQNSANDIHRILSIPRHQISVVPPIIGAHFKLQNAEAVSKYRQQFTQCPETKLVLFTGREYYKNHRTGFQVVKQLLRGGHKVKIIRAGIPDAQFIQQAVKFGLESHVESIFLTQHTELPLLYAAVDCLLFPSWYEGFGMPVVEALACGTCVVSSDAGSLSEVGGDLALTSRPDDIDNLAQQLEFCLFDRSHQQAVRENSEQWVQQFRADAVSPRLIEAYNV